MSKSATDVVVEVRGLTKTYGGRTVVDHLDLTVTAGQILGLIGANGAGKTTAVECLQGLRTPDSGSIRVLGLDPDKDATRLRALIGSQLQDSALPDRMRVSEAVYLFTGPHATDAGALLERFGLTHRLKYPFGGMSGGERQRLFLVLALLNRPRLVILDELTQGLDPAARRDVWAAVAQLRDDGTTVVLVTHELADAEALCDRVVAMRDGRVIDRGTPEDLVARHGGGVTISFSTQQLDPVALRSLESLSGVARVSVEGGRVSVNGDRAVIAHVGAWLVNTGATIPADLTVDIPTLEAALLILLATKTGVSP
jgi:ABC-2 type transport system ATP-binding protein